MNVARAFLLLVIVNNVGAFPISWSQTQARQKQHTLYSSPDDHGVDRTDCVDAAPKAKNNEVEDTAALSGLLGEMFQAKLEMSREAKELESVSSNNSDMPVLGTDGIYRIISQSQLE
jgi:hypothetical protein